MVSADVFDTLSLLFAMHRVTEHIRSDDEPELVAQTLRRWDKQVDVAKLHIEPGCDLENGHAERFHGRLRDELTDRCREAIRSLP